jgi:hypothetical protein
MPAICELDQKMSRIEHRILMNKTNEMLTVSTIRRRLAAITYAHWQVGFDSPAILKRHFVLREALAGITRTLGVVQHGAEPILTDAVRRIVAEFTDQGLYILLRWSKTDQWPCEDAF